MTAITPVGEGPSGETIHRINIGDGPLTASLLTLGATLQDVRLAGIAHSLTVGSPDIAAYSAGLRYCGAIVGPVANRITGAQAMINGQTHRFDANEGPNTLHGGATGTHAQIWTVSDHTTNSATLQLDLPDGLGGFPGNRQIIAQFKITGNTLTLTLSATTDATTLMNLANHSYWHLDEAPTTAGHSLQVAADHYTPTSLETLLPTGQIVPVENTRFDNRQPRTLQAGAEGLIDTNFCLSDSRQPLRPVAWLRGTSGLNMEFATTEPGLQVFDGHILNQPDFPGNDGPPHRAYGGCALEAQFWPDAPNNPNFPDISLRPNTPWQQITSWTFSR